MATIPYLVHYENLLQNVPDVITKCGSCCITKCLKNLFQNMSDFLLQNGTVLLQTEMVITKYDSYYEMRRLFQNTSVQ